MLSPRGLRDAFISSGYELFAEDEYNWFVAPDDKRKPFMIPKIGRLVSMTIMEAAQEYGGDRLLNAIMTGLTSELDYRSDALAAAGDEEDAAE